MDSGTLAMGAALLACMAAGYVAGYLRAVRKGSRHIYWLAQRWSTRTEALARALPPSMHAVKDELRAIMVEADIAMLNAAEVMAAGPENRSGPHGRG